jgi:hypothetical protein
LPDFSPCWRSSCRAVDCSQRIAFTVIQSYPRCLMSPAACAAVSIGATVVGVVVVVHRPKRGYQSGKPFLSQLVVLRCGSFIVPALTRCTAPLCTAHSTAAGAADGLGGQGHATPDRGPNASPRDAVRGCRKAVCRCDAQSFPSRQLHSLIATAAVHLHASHLCRHVVTRSHQQPVKWRRVTACVRSCAACVRNCAVRA